MARERDTLPHIGWGGVILGVRCIRIVEETGTGAGTRVLLCPIWREVITPTLVGGDGAEQVSGNPRARRIYSSPIFNDLAQSLTEEPVVS